MAKELWNNKNAIAKGVFNSIVRKEEIEELAKTRFTICSNCPSKVVKNFVTTCDECGCVLSFKTRCVDCKCPINKW